MLLNFNGKNRKIELSDIRPVVSTDVFIRKSMTEDRQRKASVSYTSVQPNTTGWLEYIEHVITSLVYAGKCWWAGQEQACPLETYRPTSRAFPATNQATVTSAVSAVSYKIHAIVTYGGTKTLTTASQKVFTIQRVHKKTAPLNIMVLCSK